MNTSPLCGSMLERVERIRMKSYERMEARAQIERSAAYVDALFGIVEAVTSRGRRMRRQLRIYRYQQRRRHAMAG